VFIRAICGYFGRTFKNKWAFNETSGAFWALTKDFARSLVQIAFETTIIRTKAVADWLGTVGHLKSCHKSVVCGVCTVERAVIDERTS